MEVIKRRNGIKYREKIYSNGRELKSPHFDRKSDAKAWKARKETERNFALSYGQEVKPDKKHQTILFKEYAKEWLSAIKLRIKKSTYSNYKSNLDRHILPLLKNVDITQIDRKHADQLVRKLIKDHNAKGTNKILGVLKQIIIEAKKDRVIKENPLEYYKQLKEPPKSEVYMSRDEINCFLTTNRLDENYPLYLMALNTGMRRGELAGLCWDKVCFITRQIEISRIRDRYGLRDGTKTGRKRSVPMNDEVFGLLKKLHHKRSSKLVLLNNKEEPFKAHHIYRDFKKAQLKAGITRLVRFHDLRHSFASHFMMSGGNIYDLQKILGHTQVEMTMKYAHLSPDHLVNAINIVSFNGESEEEKVLEFERRKTI